MKKQNVQEKGVQYVRYARTLLTDFYSISPADVNQIPMTYDGEKERVLIFDKSGSPFVKISKTILDGIINSDPEAAPDDSDQEKFDNYAKQITKEYPPKDEK